MDSPELFVTAQFKEGRGMRHLASQTVLMSIHTTLSKGYVMEPQASA